MNTFLEDYFTYCSENEAPRIYHTFSALACVSIIASRRVWVNLGTITTYPNIYVILVGESGSRKSTAKDIARDFIRELKDIPMAASAQTKESLVEQMEEASKTYLRRMPPDGLPLAINYSPMFLCLDEFSHFIGSTAPEHMVDFLVSIYNESFYEYKVKNGPKKTTTIEGPNLVMLACTTQGKINNYLEKEIITEGLARRTLFVATSERGDPIPIPRKTPEMHAAWLRMKEHAYRIFKVNGEFTWEPASVEWWDKWYRFQYNQVQPGTPLTGYYNSKSTQLLKLAVLMSLGRDSSLVLRVQDFEEALLTLEAMEQNLPNIFQGLGANDLNRVFQVAKSMLANSKEGKMWHTDFIREMYRHADLTKINEIITHGVETGVWTLSVVVVTDVNGLQRHRRELKLTSGSAPFQVPS